MLLGAAVVVLDPDGRVLLTRRADFEVWCLPGGMVDEGESVQEAATRELAEEAGTVSSLDRLVGVYSEVGGWSDVHLAVFSTTAAFSPGSANAEVRDLGWFAPDALPDDMFWWNRTYIEDAVAGRRGVTRRIDVTCRLGPVERSELYLARDAYDGTPAEFFRWCFPAPPASSP